MQAQELALAGQAEAALEGVEEERVERIVGGAYADVGASWVGGQGRVAGGGRTFCGRGVGVVDVDPGAVGGPALGQEGIATALGELAVCEELLERGERARADRLVPVAEVELQRTADIGVQLGAVVIGDRGDDEALAIPDRL